MSKKYTNKDLKEDFIYNLQFYFNEEHRVICLDETANESEHGLKDYLNMRFLGHEVANSDILDKENKKGLKIFCQGYLKALKDNGL